MTLIKEVNEALKRIHEEGQGVYVCEAVSALGSMELFFRAFDGDKKSLRKIMFVVDFLNRFKKADPCALCFLCGREVKDQKTLGVVILFYAMVDEPKESICSPVCDDCAQREDLKDLVIGEYRKMVPPGGFKTFDFIDEGGRA